MTANAAPVIRKVAKMDGAEAPETAASVGALDRDGADGGQEASMAMVTEAVVPPHSLGIAE